MKYPLIFLLILFILTACTKYDSKSMEIQKLEYERSKIAGVFDSYLQQNDPEIDRQIAVTIGRIGDSVHIDVLKELINSTDTCVINASIFALGQIGNTTCRDLLVQLFSDEKFMQFKAEILKSLGRIKGEESIDFLINRLPALDDSLTATAIMNISFLTFHHVSKILKIIYKVFLKHERNNFNIIAGVVE